MKDYQTKPNGKAHVDDNVAQNDYFYAAYGVARLGGGQHVFTGWVERDIGITHTHQQLPMVDLIGGREGETTEPDFQWGYPGGGPTVLASSILVDAYGRDDITSDMILRFRDEVIAKLPRSKGWVLTGDDLDAWAGKSAKELC